ncbi:MAG TPA: MYXO-CTERM sorting domain-containing protein [Polyangiaceae bacterium]|nr:MYXO-CTERM sorting domain-containing protein [Polyangiaceae bacterium]
MLSSARRFAGSLGMCMGAFALLLAEPASAQVSQTGTTTVLPQPVPMAEMTLVTDSWGWNVNTVINRDRNGMNLNPGVKYGDYYAPPTYPQFVNGDAITLGGLFKWRGEQIDPVKDAKTGPGYFSAKCGFTGQLLLMGGNCQAQFGWYNVTDPNSKTPPAATEIYPFMKGKPNQLLTCTNGEEMPPTIKTDGFCPLAWDNRHPYNLSVERWKIVTFPSGDISKDKNYKGGYVGFALIGGDPKCPQSKFSMYEHNQRNSAGNPWVTTLIYHSTVDPGGYYMAFEDLPMSAADWKKKDATSTDGGADGDFNDFVFYVTGLTCAGGNMPCDTGLQGACSAGRTDCAAEGEKAACRPVIQAGPEVCDNVDNDCDGVIDNGDGLCTGDKPICFQGMCVGTCDNGEFPCPGGLTCDDSGHCTDKVCASVTCMPGTACRAGKCVNPCDGVNCPYPQSCQLGQCVDPCKGVSCPADRVCEKGLCLSKCDCRGCDAGLTCANDGRCVDAACANVVCGAGLQCQAGNCVDPCVGVTCPNGTTCKDGMCPLAMPGDGTGNTGNTGNDPITFGGGDSGLNFGGAPSSSGGAGNNEGPRRNAPDVSAKGCGCRVGGDTDATSTKVAWVSALFALGLALHRRRSVRAPRV